MGAHMVRDREYSPWGDEVVKAVPVGRAGFLLFVLVLVLYKDHVTIKRMLAPKGIRIPGLHSYVRGYNLTQENTCCLRLQPHLYPSMVETGLGRGDEPRHSRRE